VFLILAQAILLFFSPFPFSLFISRHSYRITSIEHKQQKQYLQPALMIEKISPLGVTSCHPFLGS